MQLLKELLLSPTPAAKIKSPTGADYKYGNDIAVEGVDAAPEDPRDEEYVELPKPESGKTRGKRKAFPTTDKAENSLINTIWLYQNADAS